MKTAHLVHAVAAVAAANSTAANTLTTPSSNSTLITSTAGDATTAGWNSTTGTKTATTTADDNIILNTTAKKTSSTAVKSASTKASQASSTIVEDKEKKKNEVPRIEVDLCRADDTDTCYSASLRAGRCYDFPVIGDGRMTQNLSTISIHGGRCMIWQYYDCRRNKHTSRLHGQDLYMDKVCKGTKWSEMAASIRCCTGGPEDKEFCDVKDDKNARCR